MEGRGRGLESHKADTSVPFVVDIASNVLPAGTVTKRLGPSCADAKVGDSVEVHLLFRPFISDPEADSALPQTACVA